MPASLKALAVVLAFAIAVFVLARPFALRFTASTDFHRRCAVWAILTIVAFVSPSFWLYVAVAAPLLLWAGLKDTNPMALYALLLFVIPPLEIELPTGGFVNLFAIGQAKLLSLFVLLPLALKLMHRNDGPMSGRAVDLWILAFAALQILLLIPYEALTNTARRLVVFFIETLLVYYAFSRGVRSVAAMRDLMAAVCLSAALMASIAAFESMKQWLVYAQISERWSVINDFAYALRGGNLRAQASTGHSISLGYILAIAIGFWLYLKDDVESAFVRRCTLLLLASGVVFTFSRGAMLTAILVAIVYSALRGQSARAAIAVLTGIVAFGLLFALTPLGHDVVQMLPFVGSQDQDTIAYRQDLASASWHLIQQHPWFGDPNVLANMESLRVGGGGIVDMVNAYAGVALFYGGVGLAFFVAAFIFGLRAAYLSYRTRAQWVNDGGHDAKVGACLLTCMVATLVFMATAGHAWLQWPLLGLLVAYASFPIAAPHAAPSPPLARPLGRRPASA